uniref:Uncharacterized protein n=1 Tax=Candidatus Kentrum eta TaxID=2126337 RepID=A0A450VE59_9GAMM|nr:MAG: hypothetical protein BECKH772A_GA0070896_103042 [Candidatus Kentron sp. H]VFK03297.1 MAG: hypothetical protein BECKH772B_GA0070898_103422 [Candidatus Kentron sp. H]VFK06068.1 MAG: hypothetical protein BECKH772C_GA0070978_103242 [Candidatus Kentron sp. H]
MKMPGKGSHNILYRRCQVFSHGSRVTLVGWSSLCTLDFVKSISIRWKGFGLYCVSGYVLIVVSLRNYYQTILGSSSSPETRNGAAKNFCSSCFGYSSTTNLESNNSLSNISDLLLVS